MTPIPHSGQGHRSGPQTRRRQIQDAETQDAETQATRGAGDAGPMPSLGERIRAERSRLGMTLRALGREVGVSASMISQIENAKTQPSVSTLYAITSALGLSIQEVFDAALRQSAGETRTPDVTGGPDIPGPDRTPPARGLRIGPVVRPGDRQSLVLDTGVVWERLGEIPPQAVDFLHVTYPPGGTSSSSGGLMRHPGSEYGYLISGELLLTLGFEKIPLGPGDAISFDSTTPHSYHNTGTEPAVGIWFVTDAGS